MHRPRGLPKRQQVKVFWPRLYYCASGGFAFALPFKYRSNQ
jgi:hypothetical protein